MFKIILTFTILSSIGQASDNYFLTEPKNPVSKLDAVKATLENRSVYKCDQVTLTDKVTFKKVKAIKN